MLCVQREEVGGRRGQLSEAGALGLTSGWGWAPVTAPALEFRDLRTQSWFSEAAESQADEIELACVTQSPGPSL